MLTTPDAGQGVDAADVHGAGSADALAARPDKSNNNKKN